MKVKITTLLVLVMSLFTLSASAQAEHLKFMDIPIDGTLPVFCKLLDQKLGTKLEKKIKKTPKYLKKLYPLAHGEIIYEGAETYVSVSAHEIDKPVHQVHLLIKNPSDPEKLYKKISGELQQKYVKDKKNVEVKKANGTEMVIITVIGEGNEPIGRIQASISEANYQKTSGTTTSTGTNFGVSIPIGSTGISVGTGASSGFSSTDANTYNMHEIFIGITYIDLVNSKGDSKLKF